MDNSMDNSMTKDINRIGMDAPKDNVILVGFMGTGKSTVGRRLAKLLGRDFIDTDVEIERLTEMTVSEIFRRHGETRFRSEERLLVKRLADQKGYVIATGGGTVLNPDNWQDLAQSGVIIGLYAPLDEIYKRIGYRNDRPLLRGDRQVVEELWAKRQPIYNQANWTVDTTDKGIDEVVQEIFDRCEGGALHAGTED
ncbi:shikimate kinase [Desulfitobacterium dichloroeliminans LMG P-21439]|uniref:Shikimate kinase n=2 Tax=Desulfitobacterium dichloroeliminans TaxID=233055 RepID=L0FB46_DESDL|nr:shikimate kinase [Desulfitobacterium dichloroeliminans LMG P-21439]